MTARIALVAALFAAAVAAQAAHTPFIMPSYVQVRPGETTKAQVSAAWRSGVSWYPFTGTWSFTSEDPSIATIDGVVLSGGGTQYDLKITGLQPGITYARVVDASGPTEGRWATVVVTENDLPVYIAVNGVVAKGHPVTLTVVTDEPDAAITWYAGAFGYDIRWGQVATGRQFTFVPQYNGSFAYWVVVMSPGAAGAAGITVDVHESPVRRRRTSRH